MAENDDWEVIDDWEEVPIEAAVPADTGIDFEAVGAGAIQGGSFGLGDEMAGLGAEFAASQFLGGEGPIQRTTTRGLDAPLDTRSEYQVGRDEARRANEELMARSPKSYLGGELLGGIATAPATGGAAGKALGALGKAGARATAAAPRLAPAVLEGVGVGALEGAGRSEADLVEGEFAEFGQDVGVGVGFGAALPAAAKGVGAAGRGAARKFLGDPAKRFVRSERATLRQAGLTPAQAALKERQGKLGREAGSVRELAERGGAGRIPQTTPAMLESVQGGLKQAGDELKDLNRQASELRAVVDGTEVAAEIRALGKPYGHIPGGEKIIDDVEQMAIKMEAKGVLSLEDAAQARSLLYEQLKLDSPTTWGKIGKQIYGAWRGAMQRSVAAELGQEAAQKWSRLNSLVSAGIDAEHAGMKRSAVEAGQVVPTAFGLLGATGGLAMSEGDPLKGGLGGLALGLVGRGVRDRSRGIRANYNQILGNMAQRSQNPAVQQSAKKVLDAWQTPGIAGAVELYKEHETNAEFREELQERQDAR